jgi:HK97 gp10 family phage protein
MTSDLNRLEIDLGQMGPRMIEQAGKTVRSVGQRVVHDAKLLCPVDTGNLRASIGVEYDGDSLGFRAGPTASYGHFLEFGTSRMAPHAYMGPAFDRAVPLAVQALGQLGGKVL